MLKCMFFTLQQQKTTSKDYLNKKSKSAILNHGESNISALKN
jgi:hypothetical protein